ncbi:Extracellular serine protease [Pontiella desulfatans]|uniref:Extracellular serine protease n=1 Tax=Pontiella desulfatans TaxID=2750659 RepID=A0A6C2U577_PONDE|nr:autotransporter outer membrane beta-barrel domain-containing protein [Pontiella desulfatans]VGO15218.1 Extracellular serine protease [Pontiella desulfatans]
MKQLILGISAVLLVQGALGQAESEWMAVDSGNAYNGGAGNYRANRGTSQQNSEAFSYGKAIGEAWARTIQWPENFTSSSGEASFMKGETGDVLVQLYHDVDGRFAEVSGKDGYGGATIVIDNTLTPTVKMTGKKIDRSNSRQRTADNAVTIWQLDSYTDWPDRQISTHWNFLEGIYQGGQNFSGMLVTKGGLINIQSASFLGGIGDAESSETDSFKAAPSGIAIAMLQSGLIVNNISGDANDLIAGSPFSGSTVNSGGGNYNGSADFSGGDGLYAQDIKAGGAYLAGDFKGSVVESGTRSIEFTNYDTVSGYGNGRGGRGAVLYGVSGGTTIENATFLGGGAAQVTVGGPDGLANAVGGEGLILVSTGTTTLSNAIARAGISSTASIIPGGYYDLEINEYPIEILPTDDNGTAIAHGGAGVRLESVTSITIDELTATGSAGGSASVAATNGYAGAVGGHGLSARSSTVVINSGTFKGGNGGFATSGGTAEAFGGAGVYVNAGSLTINGGEFTGGKGGRANGETQAGNYGLVAEEANVTINEVTNTAPTIINGDIYVSNDTTSKALNILGGSIGGDIYSVGSQTTTMKISTNATYTGSFEQTAGTVIVDLDAAEEAKFFTDVSIVEGTMQFNDFQVITEAGSSFVLGNTNSILRFGQGAYLTDGTVLDAGYGTVESTAGNIEMGDNSRIYMRMVPVFDTNGVSTLQGGSLTGNLVLSNTTAKIQATGIAAEYMGDVQISTGNVLASTNDLQQYVSTDFGWLTQTTAAKTNNGLVVEYGYKSVGSELEELSVIIGKIDNAITNLANTDFYALNALGADTGSTAIRYSIAQIPDATEAAFQNAQQMNHQIAARNTEFRSMNGFASTTPKFTSPAQPTGVAGPKTDDQRTWQGWIRAYGSKGDRDASENFSAYEMATFGTVIGIDKNFGNLLLGFAGGYSRSDIDAESYNADVKNFHGSIYSTVGGESFYVDMALTLGSSKTEESSSISGILTDGTPTFNSGLFSAYVGGGMTFDIAEKISLTPEASLLTSMYGQEEFKRSGAIYQYEDADGNTQDEATYEAYGSWSALSSLGVNLSTFHQLDWLNQGLAFIPEVRAHWLHEFNADQEDFDATIYGTPVTLGVRSREEDLMRLGLGFDVWNWKYQNTKFEIDYDGLFSKDYQENIISGKVTYRF